MPPIPASIRIFQGLAGFQALREEWQTLAQACGTHFLHFPGWYGAELANMADSSRVYFACLYQAGDLVAVLPLEYRRLRRRALRLPILQLFYASEMGVNDVLSRVPLLTYREALEAALRRQLPFFLLIRWQCVLEDGCAISFLNPREKPRYTHLSKLIDFSLGAARFWEDYSPKFRRDLRKKKEKALKREPLQLVRTTRMEELPAAFAQFLQVENSGWKGASGTSIEQQPQKRAFYESLLHDFGQLGLCHINLLRLDQVPIAAQFGVCIAQRLYLLKIGYRESYSDLSPGHLLIEELVEQSSNSDSVRSLSFVTGVEWIDRWHPRQQRVGIFYTGNGTWFGALVVKVVKIALRTRDALRRRG